MDKGGLKQSRFSTLKVFKFGKNAAQQAPPPLPPKDPGYLAARNRSLASLSPDSLPASPLSGDQYGASSSAVSLALPQQKQRSGLFKSKKPPTPTPTDDDENISMPWNFQHNVHVDEGFTGMPPSWNTSLQEAGFSEDEIAAIQQRRMPMPAALVKPAPRSTSLPKNQAGSSAASIHSEPHSTYSSPEPQSTYSSPKSGYRDYKPPPSPKSPPPMYNYEQPLPLNIVRGQPSAAYTGHARAESQQSSSSSHSGSYSSRSRSPSPQQAPAPKLNAKNLTLDLAPLGDAATDSTWSEGVLSATPWSASAFNTSHPKPSPPISASSASFLPTLSPPSSATSPLFTLTGPRGERGRSPTFEDVPGAEVHTDFSPTTAYYGLSSPGDARTPTSGGSGSSGGGGLAYDEERDDEIFGIVRSPAIASSVASPNSASYATYSDHLTVGAPGNGGSSNRDSDATMLGVPPSAGVVRHVTTVARRAVAEVVAAKQSPAAPAPTRAAAPSRPPPASPQSSHFTSSSGSGSVEGEGSHSGDSSENQMYDYAEDDERGYGREPETPRTEVNEDDADITLPAAEPGVGAGARTPLDYYLEGKSYLEENGYSLGAAAHHKRGDSKTTKPVAPISVVKGQGKEYERLVRATGKGDATKGDGTGSRSGSRAGQNQSEYERSGSRTGQNEYEYGRSGSRAGSRTGQNGQDDRSGSRAGSRAGQNEYDRSLSGSRAGAARQEEAYREAAKEEEEEEDEEEQRRKEWEAMQRGEDVRKQARAEQARVQAQAQVQPLRQQSPSIQALQTRQPQSRTQTPPQRTPPMQPPPQIPPPAKPDPRTPDARRLTKRLTKRATNAFVAGQEGAAEEEEEDDYEYGYDFVDDDDEPEYVPGAVESPGVTGAGGYGSAFGSPHRGVSAVSARTAEEEYGYGEEEEEEEEDEEGTLGPKERAALSLANAGASAGAAPALVITTTRTAATFSPGPLTALGMAQTPITPAQRYAGWVAAAVAPLEEFIDEPADPRDFYDDLREIAEGESGSVFAATLVPDAPIHKLRLPPLVKARDADDVSKGRPVLVAMKCVTLVPGENTKVTDVRRECGLLRGLWCEQVLGMDALYVDLVEDSLWIRMELMERSLADVVGLVDEGLRLQEPRIIARFASDMLHALDYLQKHHIAHRDLRSDNLLLNREGVLKLTDFSNAVVVTPDTPLATDPVGVMYWQAPEVRSGAYDPLKIDVWSVGATVWELAEGNPPFSDTQQPADRWPPVTDPTPYPPSFQEFLHMCSEPAASRPTPGDLLEAPYVQKACGRPVIVQLLSRCMAIEQALQAGDVPPDSPS